MQLWSIDWGVHLPSVYMYILWYVKIIQCNGVACSYGQLSRGSICLQYICAFCDMWKLFSVIVLYAAIVNWLGVHLHSVYMCILLYLTLIWCNGLAYSYGQLTGGSICLQYICAFYYIWNLYGVMVLHTAVVDWWGVPSAFSIYVHSPVSETYMV